MIYHLSELLPSDKDSNIKLHLRLHILFIIICIFTIITAWEPASNAQQIHYTIQDTSLFSPFSWINSNNYLFYSIDLMNNTLCCQNTSPCLYFHPLSYLFQGLSPSNDFYSYSLFLPPYINTNFGHPFLYSWFFPFLEGYKKPPSSTSVQNQVEDFMTDYLLALDEAKNLTYQDLLQKFPEGPYTGDIGYTVDQTNYYDLVKNEMGLTPIEEQKINENGFVVSTRANYSSFGQAYLDFFYKDLPVFISTDSILQAHHRSYDEILAELEEEVLMAKLELILSKAQSALPTLAPNPTGALADALYDVNIFYTVARQLLGRYTTPPPYLEDEKVQSILNFVDQLSFEWITIFGNPRKIDFSQFKPRGHYTKSEAFEKYFRSMIWLGRIDFGVEDSPRQLLDAYLIWRSIEEGGVRSAWDDMDKIIELMIGEPDSMNIINMAMLMEETGVQNPEDLLDSQIRNNVLKTMEEKGYGEQRINSHYLESCPFDPEVTPLPKSFTFMGQRFTVDSHVFSNVVYDRIPLERLLPDPLDAMFVLGNNRALHHLENEITNWQYQGNLYILRYLVDQYEKEFWEANMYNSWLDALRSLSVPFEVAGYPLTTRTSAYQDKLLNTRLASWAELRHDTILYVKQSYTSFITCEYLDGYIEPIPEFYRKLKKFADRAKDILGSINIPYLLKWKYTNHYEKFANCMNILETLAQKQIEGQPRTQEEIIFIKNTIVKKTYSQGCTVMTHHEGWYPELFYKDKENCVDPDFIVADVHTNPNNGGEILHVGVGRVNVIYFTAETCNGPTMYVGPVFSYYEKLEYGMNRLTDSDWADLVKQNSLSAPWWTYTFLVE